MSFEFALLFFLSIPTLVVCIQYHCGEVMIHSLSFNYTGLAIHRVPTAQGKQGKWSKKFPVRENTGNLEMLPKHRENTGNLVCSSCQFPDS